VLENQMWTNIFLRKSSLAMRCAFNLLCAWTHKTVGFVARGIFE
jgi:hypothetical protein